MEPISRGKGRESYTLYYPLYISDNVFKINLDKDALGCVLYKSLPEKVKVEILPRADVTILRMSNNETFEDAKKIFYILQKYFVTLAIQKSVTIYLNREPLEPEPCPVQFFSNWPEAKQKGWDTGEDENFNVDGIVDITRPCIVPEHRKIVDKGVLIGKPGSRDISKKDLVESIVENPLPRLSDRQTLAINALLTSFSLPDQRLAYLLIMVCLELLSPDGEKEKDYTEAIELLKGYLDSTSIGKETRKAIRDRLDDSKKMSMQGRLSKLFIKHKKDISSALSPSDTLKFDPKKAAKKLYKLRSKIAHELNVGTTTRSEFSEAYHIAKVCATTIIKKIVNSHRKES